MESRFLSQRLVLKTLSGIEIPGWSQEAPELLVEVEYQRTSLGLMLELLTKFYDVNDQEV